MSNAQSNSPLSRRAAVCMLGLALGGALLPGPARGRDTPVALVVKALFEGKALLEIDGRQRLLAVGETSPEGVTLLSADANGARVRVGDVAREVRLDERIDAQFARGAEPRRVLLAPAADGHYYVDGAINGTGIRFVVDTGATTVAINRRDARRIGLLYRVDGEPMLVETASGPAQAFRVDLRSVKIHAIELRGIAGVVVDGDYPSTALLGQSCLNRLDMRRDGLMLELRER
jgi:aspartyl protease family protein